MINALLTKHLGDAQDNQLRDTIYPFTATRVGSNGDYDPVTGRYEESVATVYSGTGSLYNYTIEERKSNNINVNDVCLTALQARVTGVPKIDDTITIDGQEKQVIKVDSDSAKVNWTLQLRGLI